MRSPEARTSEAVSAFSATADGIAIRIRLTPRGGRDAIGGPAQLSDGSEVIAARVAAPASEGAANDSLARLIAGALGVPRRAVRIVAGHHNRIKTVAVRGERDTLLAAARESLARA